MVIELVGTRLIAPHIGSSIFVWTAVIGTILAALSVGYTIGGRLADRKSNLTILASLLFWASIMTAAIMYGRNLLFSSGSPSGNFFIDSLLASSLFIPATLLLGTITPYIAKFCIKDLATSGRDIGTLYAVSTVGSIIGTFAGGFILVPLIGSSNIILLVALLLLSLAAATAVVGEIPYKKSTVGGTLFILLGLLLPSDITVRGSLVTDFDTPYNRGWVFDSTDIQTGKETRLYTNTTNGTQSGIFLKTPNEILFPYVHYFDLASHFTAKLDTTLLIGAGAFTYPAHLRATKPDTAMTVVEIDPALIKVAKEYFSYVPATNHRIVHQDGRIFLNTAPVTNKYDAIFIDAFSSHLSIPFHLTTQEAVSKMSQLLDDEGVVVTNLISAIDGHKGAFLHALYTTYASVFADVRVFQVRPNTDPSSIQNLILIARKNPSKKIEANKTMTAAEAALLQSPVTVAPTKDSIVLTDDFAPVDFYSVKMLL